MAQKKVTDRIRITAFVDWCKTPNGTNIANVVRTEVVGEGRQLLKDLLDSARRSYGSYPWSYVENNSFASRTLLGAIDCILVRHPPEVYPPHWSVDYAPEAESHPAKVASAVTV